MTGLSAPPQNQNQISCSAAILIIIGILCLGGAGYFGYDTYKFMSEAVYINGEVIDVKVTYAQKKDSEGNMYSEATYYPIVLYQLTEAQKYTVEGGGTSDEYGYQVGQEVEVMYLPAHPGKAHINSFWNLWGVSAIITLFALIAFAFAGLTIWLNKSR